MNYTNLLLRLLLVTITNNICYKLLNFKFSDLFKQRLNLCNGISNYVHRHSRLERVDKRDRFIAYKLRLYFLIPFKLLVISPLVSQICRDRHNG